MAVNPNTRLPNTEGEATDRLIRLFNSATRGERAYGASWYQEAHAEILRLADAHNVSVDQVAGIVAALSPRSDWPQNLARAEQLLSTGHTYGLGDGVRKAQEIRAGADPLLVLGGPKVRSFFDNLRDPLGSREVTIDVHAASAAAGQRLSDAELKLLLSPRDGYQHVADIYRDAAATLGLAPHVVQAIIWAVWRNRFGGRFDNETPFHYQRVEEDSQ